MSKRAAARVFRHFESEIEGKFLVSRFLESHSVKEIVVDINKYTRANDNKYSLWLVWERVSNVSAKR